VTDRRATRPSRRLSFAEAVRAAVAGGVDWLQIRERDLDGAALLELARELAEAARAGAAARHGEVRVLVNRRVDVALALRASGVHLGFDAVPAASARALLPPRSLVGVATHSPAECRAAAALPVDYVHLAPVFAPISKARAGRPLGLRALRDAADAGVRVLAQGGIDAESAADVVAAGAAGVAVTGAVLGARDPGAAAARLRAALDSAPPPGAPKEAG
jgi:thiamine-phosphate pyrophosphorylase